MGMRPKCVYVHPPLEYALKCRAMMQWNKPLHRVNATGRVPPPHSPQNIKETYFLKTELWYHYDVKSLNPQEMWKLYSRVNKAKHDKDDLHLMYPYVEQSTNPDCLN